MRQRFSILICAASLLMWVTGCSAPKEYTVRIIHTTDVHGELFPTDFISGEDTGGSAARLATFLHEARQKNPDLLLLDGGDLLQGTPLIYYDNSHYKEGPHFATEVYNRLGYDAMCFGNHDIEAGHEVYDAFEARADFPILCCNITRIETGKSYYQPYKIFKRNGLKIAVIGVITPAVPEWIAEPLYAGMRFEEPISAVAHTLQEVQAKAQPDLVVLLAHTGFQNRNADIQENASKAIAEQINGIDIILMGHDHESAITQVKNPQGDSVLLINPANRLQRVSDVTITIRKKGKQVIGRTITPQLTELSAYEPDSAFMKHFEAAIHHFEKEMQQPVGAIDAPLNGGDALWGSSAYMSFIHEVQLEATGAKVSFAAPLSLSFKLPCGTLTYADMFALYPYENSLYAMELTGQEIKDYLEYSYGLWVNQMHTASDHLLAFKADYKQGERFPTQNPTFNFSAAGGIRYTVDATKPAGSRVVIQSLSDGTAFSLSHTYLVAVNSYRGNGGGGHLTRGAGIPKEELPGRIKATTKDIRSAIMEKLSKQPVTHVADADNWHFIPEEITRRAIERDKKILNQ